MFLNSLIFWHVIVSSLFSDDEHIFLLNYLLFQYIICTFLKGHVHTLYSSIPITAELLVFNLNEKALNQQNNRDTYLVVLCIEPFTGTHNSKHIVQVAGIFVDKIFY